MLSIARSGQIHSCVVLLHLESSWQCEVVTCSKFSHRAFTLSRKCLEPSTLAVSLSYSSNGNGIYASGRSASATVALSATYPESLQVDHLMWLYEGVPQPMLHLQEHLRRATAGNLATTVVTLMMTRNNFMCIHLPVYMILNSCTHLFPANI